MLQQFYLNSNINEGEQKYKNYSDVCGCIQLNGTIRVFSRDNLELPLDTSFSKDIPPNLF